MLESYLKIAWRNIVGNPLFSAINIVGLGIGLACCIIITLFVRHELSYDKHWSDADRIHRVTRDFFSNNLRLAAVAPPVAVLLKKTSLKLKPPCGCNRPAALRSPTVIGA